MHAGASYNASIRNGSWFDKPTVYSGSVILSRKPRRRIDYDAFLQRLAAAGVDVTRHSSVIRQSYDDLTDGAHAASDIESAIASIRWQTKPDAGVFATGAMHSRYERRLNGLGDEYENDSVDHNTRSRIQAQLG